jgi:hypothetical protein
VAAAASATRRSPATRKRSASTSRAAVDIGRFDSVQRRVVALSWHAPARDRARQAMHVATSSGIGTGASRTAALRNEKSHPAAASLVIIGRRARDVEPRL